MTSPTFLRGLIIGVFLLAAAGVSLFLTPRRDLREPVPDIQSMIPRSFGDWKTDPTLIPVVPAPDAEGELKKIYAQVASSTFVNSRGEQIMLTIAYGGDQSHALKAHRQEFCYEAQGFQIRQLAHGNLAVGTASIPVARMLAVRGNRSEPVTYWMTIGDKAVMGRTERLVAQLRYGLTRRIPDGMMVRVSNLSTDAQESYRAHQQFVATLTTAMKAQDIARLLGSPG
jgi:EpsI family protein